MKLYKGEPMDYIRKINDSLEELPRGELIKNLVELSLKLYRKYLEAGKPRQYCLLLTDCNGEEIIHLCYRADVTYFTYFESLREHLIAKCYEKGVSIVLYEMPHGKELLPQSGVEPSKYVEVFSEERQKLSLRVAQIECLELHPSIQKKGIFSQIVNGLLAMEENQSVIVTNIYNDSFLEHLKKTATETVILPCTRSALFENDYD